ncbi:MAG: hypothetical protein ABII90_10320 [Bacteroidota bacterium]
MKTTKFLLSSALAVSICICFQNEAISQAGQKYAIGGNDLSGSDRFGSNNYAGINIYTNSIQRGIITQDGWFGWGTTTPSAFFNISGGDALFEINVTIDSLLTAGSLVVYGNSEIYGLLTIGNTLIFDGTNNSISSSTGTVDFLNSNILTTANIKADTITGNVINANYFSINQGLLNGLQVTGQTQTGSLLVDGDATVNGTTSVETLHATTLQVNNGIVTNTLTADTVSVTRFQTVARIEADTINVTRFQTVARMNAVSLHADTINAETLHVDTGYAETWHAQTGNVQTLHATSMHADTINTASINSSQYLLNGSPLTGSQWVSSGSDIYYTGGNVGINTNNPQYPLHVDGNAVVTGSIAGENLFVEKSVNIGAFKFINGAIQPGQKDTIKSPAEIVIKSEAEKISFNSDTVTAKNVLVVQTVEAANKIKALEIETDTLKAKTIKSDSAIEVANGLVIDGISSRITAPGGNIYFDDENLITTGAIASQDLYVQRAINIGDFKFKNGAILPGQKDTISSTKGIVIESKTEMIQLSSDTVTADKAFKAQTVEASIAIKAPEITTATLKATTVKSDSAIKVAGSGLVIDGINNRITSGSGTISLDDDNLVTTGSIAGQDLYVQNSVNIGAFKFINGAIQPGEKDTIKSPAEIVVSSEAEKILLESDTVTAKNVLEAQTLKTATLSA